MGDLPSTSTAGEDHVAGTLQNTSQPGATLGNEKQHQAVSDYARTPQYQQHTTPIHGQNAFTTQFNMTQSHPGGHPDPYNMTPMANSLPHVAQVGFRPGQYPQAPHPSQQRFNQGASPSMMPQMPQFAGHPSMAMPAQGYYVQQPQMSQYYAGQMSPTQPAQAMPPRQTMAFYPNQMMINPNQSAYYYPPTPQYPGAVHNMPNAMMAGQYVAGPVTNDPRTLSHHPDDSRIPKSPSRQELESTERRQSTVRGPPRKPRQRGHAIWIGNLPPQTELMSLVHHVCKEAHGLESLFLISKSNCAFANFKDENTCTAAQQKLHDSKFQSVRLVSRLRKSTVEGATGITAPTGPAIGLSGSAPQVEPEPKSDATDPEAEEEAQTKATPPTDTNHPKDRFFILKSLTVEDLELSVKTGIWATQSHNEDVLNNAFQAVDAVYLIFSANKSGEYFGYARMMSKINDDPAAAIEFAPKAQATTGLDLPKAIPTDATEYAPKGRIIDDSARGTIFWEAEKEDADKFSDAESDVSSVKSAAALEDGAMQTWGKPFKLEWLSTTRLPFYRTRGLRNPWNSNREVKIARDGTEIEPSVGRRLIGLFNRIPSPVSVPAGMRVPVAMMPGFPPMRPYGQ